MGFQIPNGGEVPNTAGYANGALAYRYSSDDAIIEAALEGYCVQPTGCQLQAGTTTGTVKISAGTMFAGGVQTDVLAQDNVACVSNANASNPLWILYELDTSQTLQANVGTAANPPVPPVPSAGHVVVGSVFVPSTAVNTNGAVDAATSSANGNAKILDKRVLRSMIDTRYYTPTYSTPNDVVINTTATTVAVASNTVNLNTFVGAQTLNVASTTGLLGDGTHGGVVILTHSATDYVITYTAVGSSTTLTGCTAVGAPNQTISTADVVTRAKVITSASQANFNANQVGSFVRANTNIQQYSPTFATIVSAGTVPAQSGMTYAQISVAAGGSGTAQAISVAQVLYTWTKPTNTRLVFARVISPGQSGAGGRCGATSSVRGGGGGGGGGGIKSRYLDAGDLGATETVTVGQGTAPGAGGGSGASGNNSGSSTTSAQFGAHVVASNMGGFGLAAGGTTAPGGAGGSGSNDSDLLNANNGALSPLFTTSYGGSTLSAANASVGVSGAGLPGGGGGGGAADASNNRRGGGQGGTGDPSATSTGGTPGAASDGTAGGNAAATTKKHQIGGGGAGGTASLSSATSGGNGGNGATPGGGGGGGGAGTSGGAGTGGNGGFAGDGSVLVISYP